MHWRMGAGVLGVVVLVGGWYFGPAGVSGSPPMQPPDGPHGGRPPGLPPILPPNAPLKTQLGLAIFFDTNLSNPPGQSCGSCHAPQVGWTFPNSEVNLNLGPVPGAVQGRFGNRKPPTISYAQYTPVGPPALQSFGLYVGGVFWDGRAASLAAQVPFPLGNPNEMNNVDLVHNVSAPQEVVPKIAAGPYAGLFKQVYGQNVFTQNTPLQVFPMVVDAVANFESAPAVSPFTSKYDAWLAGKAQLTPSELNGLRLSTGSTTGRPGGPAFTPNAQCTLCHSIPTNPSSGPDLFTGFAYLNIGFPKNPNNPYYTETNAQTNPLGYNPLGAAYIDYGLGDYIYPNLPTPLPSGNVGKGSNGQGDFKLVNGLFKTPTLRNVDKRPQANFVKAYGHNGFFKSLQQLVHFDNTRNLTTKPGEVIDFTRPNPYAGLKGQPLWPPPEYIGNLTPGTMKNPPTLTQITMQNPSGTAGGYGNLGLTPQQEADIVAFLQTLSDGYFQK